MAAKRTLVAMLTAGLLAGVGRAQPVPPAPPALPPPPASAGTGNSMLAPPIAVGPSATGMLTAPTTLTTPGTAGLLPAGSYAGPYCGPNAAGAGCNGPVGAHGPLTYELYLYTGPSFIVGGDRELQAALGTGWAVSGGGKTLHFNQAADAAWVLTTGITYLYSGGDRDYIGVGTRRPPFNNPNDRNDPRNGQVLDLSEPVNAYKVKAFNRTAFEFAVGRDWWLDGPAAVGAETGWNSRFGVDVGGRWGHSSISLVPLVDPGQYFRRSGVFHAATIGAHYTVEVPMGAWIGFVGGRLQWAYNWSNVVPPVGGNTQDLGVLFTAGVRF